MQLKASKVTSSFNTEKAVQEWGRGDKITGKKKFAATSCEQI